MAKSLELFLRDTAIFISPADDIPKASYPNNEAECLEQIAAALKIIDGSILELDQGPVISVMVDPEFCILYAGKLGRYSVPRNSDELRELSQCLWTLAHTSRFIKAIQGMWPA